MAGKTFPTFPAHAQPAILLIWQEAHSTIVFFLVAGANVTAYNSYFGQMERQAEEVKAKYSRLMESRGVRHGNDICLISAHWNGNIVILTRLPSLAAREAVILTTYGTTSKKIFVKMTTFLFQCDVFIHIKDSAPECVKSSALAMELSHSCDIYIIVEWNKARAYYVGTYKNRNQLWHDETVFK